MCPLMKIRVGDSFLVENEILMKNRKEILNQEGLKVGGSIGYMVWNYFKPFVLSST